MQRIDFITLKIDLRNGFFIVGLDLDWCHNEPLLYKKGSKWDFLQHRYYWLLCFQPPALWQLATLNTIIPLGITIKSAKITGTQPSGVPICEQVQLGTKLNAPMEAILGKTAVGIFTLETIILGFIITSGPVRPASAQGRLELVIEDYGSMNRLLTFRASTDWTYAALNERGFYECNDNLPF